MIYEGYGDIKKVKNSIILLVRDEVVTVRDVHKKLGKEFNRVLVGEAVCQLHQEKIIATHNGYLKIKKVGR